MSSVGALQVGMPCASGKTKSIAPDRLKKRVFYYDLLNTPSACGGEIHSNIENLVLPLSEL
jgi:hypothetical protein